MCHGRQKYNTFDNSQVTENRSAAQATGVRTGIC